MPDLISIKNGEWDLISSGTMIVDASKLVSFTLRDNGDPMYLEFKFENSDSKDDKPFQKAYKTDDNHLGVVFYNYNSIFGNWNQKPVFLGGMFDRELYLHYLILGLNDSLDHSIKLKKIEYSFYLGAALDLNRPEFKKTTP